jgi:hypothetical protein
MNNLEQGFVLAFLGTMALSAFMGWLALKTLALQSLDMAHAHRRQAEALEAIASHLAPEIVNVETRLEPGLNEVAKPEEVAQAPLTFGASPAVREAREARRAARRSFGEEGQT